jgi:predicted phage terminase large subunit-like protein
VDVWRQQVDTAISTEAFIDLVDKYKPYAWAADSDLMVKSVGPFVRTRMNERKKWVPIEELSLGGKDKAVRAQAIRGRVGMGKVYFPVNQPWMADLRREMMAFPVGVNDDQVDALGLIGRMLDQMAGRRPSSDPKPTVRTPYTKPDNDAEDDWMMT